MSGLEAQLNRLELQIYQYYPQLQRDSEAAKFERRQRLREQLRCSCPKVQLPQLHPHMSLKKIQRLLAKCQNLGLFDASESDELSERYPQLFDSSEEEMRPSRSMRRNMLKRKARGSSHGLESRRSHLDSTMSFLIAIPTDRRSISINLERQKAVHDNVPSRSVNAVGNNHSDSFMEQADDSGAVVVNISPQDEVISCLMSEMLAESADATETWRATTALDNINNKVNDNYDVCVEQTPTSSQPPKKVRKQSKKQTKTPKEPPKKRGRKRRNTVTVEPKSDVAKYLELFSSSCTMTGCATPAHSSTMSQQLVTSTTQHLDGAEQQREQQPVTYYLEGDWANGGNCQLISTESVSIEGPPEEFNVTELVNYIDNVGNDAGNVIARVLDAPGVTAVTAPVITNMQLPMQQSQPQQLAQPFLRPAHSSEGVLDLSKKATTAPSYIFVVPRDEYASTSSSTAEAINDVDDCMPLDLSLKTTSVLAKPASPPRASSVAIIKTTSQGPFTVDDYESFRAALDMPLIDIDDNMSAFMEMTSNTVAANVHNTETVESASVMSQTDNTKLAAHDNLAENTANREENNNLIQNDLLNIESKDELIDEGKREVESTNNREDVANVTVYKNVSIDDVEPHNVSNNIDQNDAGTSSHDEAIDRTLGLTCNSNITGQVDGSIAYQPSNMQLVAEGICLDLSKREFDEIGNEAYEPPSELASINGKVGNVDKDSSNLCLDDNADNSVNGRKEGKDTIRESNNCSKSSDNSAMFEARIEDKSLILAVANGNVITAPETYEEKKTHCTTESVEEAFAIVETTDSNYNSNVKYTVRSSPSVASVESNSSCVCNENEHRGSSECNEQEAGNSKKEMVDVICEQGTCEPNCSDKLSLDLLFVDVESLTPCKSVDHADMYATANQNGDPLNYEVVGNLLPKVEHTKQEKYDDYSLEHIINESSSSIDLIENMEDNNKLNVSLPMPQLTLMEHNSEDFTSMHLEHDCESSDSVPVSLEGIENADVKKGYKEIAVTETVTGVNAEHAEDCKCNECVSPQRIDLTADSSLESIVAATNTSTLSTGDTLESGEQAVDIKIAKCEKPMDANGISKSSQETPNAAAKHVSSPQRSSAKSNCLLTHKNERDLFPSLSVLELESQLDDVCLDFEGELDDDALSLSTSCFNSPDEDRFADLADADTAEQQDTKQLDKTVGNEQVVSSVCDELRTTHKITVNSIHVSTTRISNTNGITPLTDGLRKFKIPKVITNTTAEYDTTPSTTISAPPPMVVLPPSTTITSQEIMTTRPVATMEKGIRTVQNVCAVTPLPLPAAALIAPTTAAVNTAPSLIRDMLQLPLPLPAPAKVFAGNAVAGKVYLLDDADSEDDIASSDNAAHISRGLIAGTGGEGLNYGPKTLEVAQTFGVTCLPFLVDECFSLAACPLSHNYRDAVVVQNFLDTLSEPNLCASYKFMYAHERLFRRYFAVFCRVYAHRNNRDKLLNMVYDCERYDEGPNSLRMLFYSLGMCGFNKVNACRQILSRYRFRSRSMIDALVRIIMETDWTMFCDYIERFTEARDYHFRIDVLNQMAPTVLRANNTRLAAVFFKCLVNLEPNDLTLLQHSPAVLQLLELMKSGQMCG